MKEKIKEFWAENKEHVKQEASRALWLAIGVGAGCCIGNKITLLKIENGFNKCIIAKPELEAVFCEAWDLVKEKYN